MEITTAEFLEEDDDKDGKDDEVYQDLSSPELEEREIPIRNKSYIREAFIIEFSIICNLSSFNYGI